MSIGVNRAGRRPALPLAAALAAAVLSAALLSPGGALAQAGSAAPAPAPSAPPQASVSAAAESAAADDTKAAPGADADAKAAPAGDGKADGSQSKPIELNGVTVQGKRNPMDDSDKHLKQLQDSLPCNGCDAKPPTHKKLVNKVLDAVGDRVLPTPAPDHSTRDPNDKAAEFSQENNCSASNVGGCVAPNARP